MRRVCGAYARALFGPQPLICARMPRCHPNHCALQVADCGDVPINTFHLEKSVDIITRWCRNSSLCTLCCSRMPAIELDALGPRAVPKLPH